ncbi:hemerythrin domain-containing protein [Shewanella colwelliana]|uniref:hemerythrin domain-containing protein n=1 Tax=Shewanella colwelliana TaxID=23 RepID=UPI0022B02585|nr:hemerythrin domain-containing protein [Shewanella colwelliana]MCZ4336248.1 hemerythrin domain-containing protein [Shewanella colwelliana]
MLARLHNDHKHIAILLKILQNKQQRLESAEPVNFNLIRDIVEYMQSYAEHSHHPLEDLIDDYFKQRHPEGDPGTQLADEHHRLIDTSTQLMSLINLILSDVPVANAQLSELLRDYVALQKNHMIFEETTLFPKWQAMLSLEDWQKINDQCQERLITDPLFNDDDNLLFEELREYLQKAED